jgi:hypothetical protein
MKRILILTLLTLSMSAPALADGIHVGIGFGPAAVQQQAARSIVWRGGDRNRGGDRDDHRGYDRDDRRGDRGGDRDGWHEWREHRDGWHDEWREHRHLVSWQECHPTFFFGIVCSTRTAWR